MAEYKLVHMFNPGDSYLETQCVGSCPKLYRIDNRHAEFEKVRTALDLGDRSVICCYHRNTEAT